MNDDSLLKALYDTPEEIALVWLLNHQETKNFPEDAVPSGDRQRLDVEQTLVKNELIDAEFTSGREWNLTARGERLAEKLVASKVKGARRRAAVEKALMTFIEDDEPDDVSEFTGTHVLGIKVTESEFDKAIEALEEFGLAKVGFKSFGGGLHHVALTPSGRAAADDPRDPIDFVRQGGVVNNDNRNHLENHGTIGNAVAGDHAVQRDNSFYAQSVSDISTLLQDLSNQLGKLDDVPEPALQAVEQMRAEIDSPSPSQGRLGSFLAGFTGAIASKFGEDTYQAFPEIIAQLGTLISNMN